MQYTFLELVQMTARESGTVPSEQPQTLVGQTGRLAKIPHWVNLAWTKIQNHHQYWRWMHDEFEGVTAPGMSKYSSLQMGITRFARWVTLPDTLTIHSTLLGKGDEQFIAPLEYWRYRRLYDVGLQEVARPSCYTVSPGNLLCFGPTPDAEYNVRGEYYKSPQTLSLDNDVPELPEQFRPIIGWYALLLLSQYDEGGFPTAAAQQKYREFLSDLEHDQLPTLYMAGPLMR